MPTLRKVYAESLIAVANAIRTKGGTTQDLEFPTEFVTAIENLPEGTADTIQTVILDGASTVYENSSATAIPNFSFYRVLSLVKAVLSGALSCGNSAFLGCTALEEVSLPLAASVGQYAFSECSMLSKVLLPLATSLGNFSFNGCSALSVTDFSEVTSVGQYAFQNAGNSLLELSFPKATSVSASAFYLGNFKSISLPRVQTINGSAFHSAVISSGELVIPATCTSLGNGNAFNNTNCQRITFEGQVPTIPVSTFARSAGKSLITYYDFSHCTSVPALANTNAFNLATSARIVVPDDLYDTWIASTNWSNSNIKPKIVKASAV